MRDPREEVGSVGGLVVVHDASGRYLRVSPGGEALPRESASELVGRTLHDVLPRERADEFLAQIRRCLATQQTIEFDYAIAAPSGEVAFYAATLSPISDETVVWVARDVTEGRKAAEAVRRKEEMFRAVVEDQTEMIVRWKPDGTRTFVNQAYCRLFELPEEQLVGTSFLPLVAEEYRQAVWNKVRSLTPENPVATMIHQSVTPTGERRWQEWTDRAIFDAEGQVVELQSTGRDITERLAAEAALRDSEERYRLLFDGNPLPMLVYDPETTRLLAVNEAAVAQYGYTRDELLTMTVGNLAVPDDPRDLDLRDRPGARRPAVVHVGRRQHLRRDGRPVDVDITSLEVPFAGRMARLALARDLTELVSLEASLKRSETMAAMGALVAGVAHEIRNPLFSISATLDAIEADHATQAGYMPYAALLRSQVIRLKQLATGLLDYGRPTALRKAPHPPADLVRIAARSCALLARETGVRVVEDVPADLPPFELDGGRMQQVIENLVTNAIQHSSRDAEVVVTARVDAAGGLCLWVDDEGPGVPPAEAAQLFEPFVGRRRGGTGLGLSIVRRIVEDHGGRVGVDNRQPRGARFSVWLPGHP